MAAEKAGSIYFADRNNHCVRRIDPSGAVSLIAGKESLTGHTHEAAVPADSLPLLPIAQTTPRIDLTWEYVFESGSDDNAIYAVTAADPDVAYVSGDIGTGADWRLQQLRAGKPGCTSISRLPAWIYRTPRPQTTLPSATQPFGAQVTSARDTAADSDGATVAGCSDAVGARTTGNAVLPYRCTVALQPDRAPPLWLVARDEDTTLGIDGDGPRASHRAVVVCPARLARLAGAYHFPAALRLAREVEIAAPVGSDAETRLLTRLVLAVTPALLPIRCEREHQRSGGGPRDTGSSGTREVSRTPCHRDQAAP